MAIDFSFEIRIERPPAEVFAVVTDPARLREWQPLVVDVQLLDADGPLREGSRIREVREVRGKRIEQVVQVSRLEPPERFGLRILEGPLPVHADWAFTEAPGGATRLHVHAHGGARGAMRVVEPVLPLVLKRQLRSQHERLKALCER